VYWREIAALSEDKAMSDNVTTALQVNATTGNGETVVLHERRLVTFKIQGNGPTSAGQITIECCPQPSPIASGSGSGGAMVWTTGLKIESDTHEADNFLRTLGGQDAEIAMISATEWQRSGASIVAQRMHIRSRQLISLCHCRVESKRAQSRVNYWNIIADTLDGLTKARKFT
jgi:hypothetical protein